MAGPNTLKQAYSPNAGVVSLAPRPVISVRNPTTSDTGYPIGTNWINTSTQTAYILVDITNNQAIFTTAPASGAELLTALIVDPGDIEIVSGDLLVDAGNIQVTAGDVSIGGDLDVTGNVTITGDIDFTSAQLIDLTSTLDAAPSILLNANGGINEQILLHSEQGTSVDSIKLLSDDGGIYLYATNETSTDAIKLQADAGGINIVSTDVMAITGAKNGASAVVINATNGGLDLQCTAAGAGEDLNIVSTGSSVNITSTESVSDAVVLFASGAAGGVQIKSGTGGIQIGNQATATTLTLGNIAPTVSRATTIGGGTVVTAAVTDTINVGTGGATTNADSIKVVNVGTGNVTTGENNINIGTGTAGSGTHAIAIGTGTGGGTKTITMGNADGLTTIVERGILSFNPSTNANITMLGGTSTGSLSIGNALSGAIIMQTAANVSLAAATASNFTVTGASVDLTLASVGGSVKVNASEAVADAIVLTASNAAGGIQLTTGGGAIALSSAGAVSMVPATGSVGSPTASQTINSRVIVATFTGFTTAAAASQVFTIVSSAHIAGSGVLVTVANKGAADAQMNITRVNTTTAGTIAITVKNDGAAALNGDVVITVWIIS